MAEAKMADKGKFILVQWESKTQIGNKLQTFIKAKCREEPIIKLGKRDGIALLEFKEAKGVKFLNEQLRDDKFWTLTSITVIEETSIVKITNVPDNTTPQDIFRFLTNKSMVNNIKFKPNDVEVSDKYFRPQQGYCVVKLTSATEVHRVCKESKHFQPFKKKTLAFEPYYEEIDPVEEADTDVKTTPIKINVDGIKLKYLRNFYSEEVQKQFDAICCKIVFLKEGLSKVKIEFDCRHDTERVKHGRDWDEKAGELVSKVFDNIAILRKTFSSEVWDQVQKAIQNNLSDKLWADDDESNYSLTLVGLKDSKELQNLEKALDAIEMPKPIVSKDIKGIDTIRVKAFDILNLKETFAVVDVVVDKKENVIRVRGEEESIKKAEKDVLVQLANILVESSSLKSIDHAKILTTPLMHDKIEAIQDQMGERCGYVIEKDKLTVFATGGSRLEEFVTNINNLVKDERVIIKGKIADQSAVSEVIKNIERHFSPYVILRSENSADGLIICVVCGTDYLEQVKSQLDQSLGKTMIREEQINLSQQLLDYLNAKYRSKIENLLKKANLPKDALKMSLSSWKAEGDFDLRSKVKQIVASEVRNIKTFWKEVELDGIHDYFNNSDGYDFLKKLTQTSECKIRFVTQNEMKRENIHCIVPLETGQAIFVGTGSLTELKIPVDVVVNAANTKLEHRGGLAGQIVKEGGKVIQDECNAYILKHGELKPGGVFNGSPGKMPCQRIFHAVGPEWKGGNTGEETILQNLLDNILDTMSSESEYILQSIAMPLISTGVFGFPKQKAARIMMSALSKKYKHVLNVREIFFYDLNPDTVRTIQRQMQGIFGNKCYHLPVKDIALGQGTMMFNTGTKGDIIKLRSGSRTLPLPGKKKLIIQWGELHTTSADLLVNATHTAPKPSGKTSDGLKQEAGASFDMAGTCEKAFKDNYQNGNIPDGAMVITDAGRIQNVKKIMHLKIPQKWESSNGRKNLEENIVKCLKEANRSQMTTMAFPTIGTADCSYPGDEVATTFIRSISKFMWEQKSCSLKKIYVVIYKSDNITTSAFECIIEKIYSMRPHRLVADIEETLEEEHKEGENDKTKKPEQNVQRRPPSPVRREPSIYKDKGRQKSQFEGSFNVNATSSAVVELEIGSIDNSKADVIVCTTSSFPNLHGAIANAIVKTGGKSLQDECKTKYQTYPNNGVASSGPGKLSCKEVFYVVLSDYNSNNGKDIYEGVFRCLEQAENNQMKSIAMPTFGTGGFKFPDQISSSQTFKAITDFFQNKRQYLSMIVIVMFGQAQLTCQEFQKEAQRVFTPMVAPAPVRTSDTAPKGPKPSSSDVVQLQWKIPNSSITLEITKGNIELAKADVILNTTSSYPHLNGIIPMAISKAAGPQLQQECLTFKGNVTKGMIEETNGYNLNCTKVYHYVMPEWKHNTGEEMIMNCIDDCLYKMKKSGLTSVAIPSIGTGGMRYEPALVARGIYSAVAEFGSKNKDIKCNINVVLFPAATAVNQTFVDELQQFMKDNGSGGKQGKQEKGVRFSAPSGDQNDDYYNDDSIQIPTRKRDFVLFELTSDDPKTVEATFKKITDQIQKETKAPTIELKKDNHIDDLDLIKQGKKNKKFLERIGEMYRVNVTFDEKSRKIRVKGLGANVIKCFERITKFMQDLREQYVSKNLGSIVYQNVEWYYTEDNGCIYVPYPKHISYRLEDAFASQATETEFRDNDDKTYVVDFNKNEEYVKGERDSKTTVSVIRKDTAEGAAHTLPAHWTPMKNENLEEVILKPTDQDYKDTETSFRAAIGAFKISQIKEIRRIQNKTLYQQYQTKKEELESKLKNMPNLERTLWHGTKAETEKSIISNGFNRSYAGNTFNGMVWYGMGVYFAVKSEYSTGDQYSPPDNVGWKRVFLAKVLTGETTQVIKGYKDRYAPTLPGSNIDRYHSTCDDQANPKEFVIYNDIQAYPEYLIIFK